MDIKCVVCGSTDIKFFNHIELTTDKQFCDIKATCNECEAELNIAYKVTYVSEE